MASRVTRDFEFTRAVPGDYALSVATIVASKPTGYVTTRPRPRAVCPGQVARALVRWQVAA
jgi:hypothetical protein